MRDIRPWLDRCLRRLATPWLRPFGRRMSSFHACGLVGWSAAFGLAASLTRHSGLEFWVTTVLTLGTVVTFAGLTMLTKILVGEEIIVYYHHEIAVVLVSSWLLWLLGRPILPYLDVVLMGLGLFLACGRVGCLMVGCCHGQPHSWGVAYGLEHARTGFPPHLLGVQLFPIQLVEALFVVATVAVGTVLMLRDAAPGSALAFYSIVYGLGRFSLEFFRGDSDRPYWRGGSEAQWTSFGIMLTVLTLSAAGWIPFAWSLLVATLVMAAMLSFAMVTDEPHRRLLRPRHVGEIAALLDAVHGCPHASGKLQIGQTSLGLRISASTVAEGDRSLDVFAFSDEASRLDDKTARRLARVMSRLHRTATDGRLQTSDRGVYHLILPAATPDRELTHAL